MSQLKHRRCAQLWLIFGIVLTIATTKTLAATETTTTKVAAGIVNNAANAVTPTGVFTNVEQPLYDAPAAAVVGGGSAPSTTANSQYYPDEDSYVPYRSDTHDEFSWTLIKQILQEEKQSNVIVSPFSVKLVLSMLLEAAGNNTQTQKELVRTLTDLKSPDNIRGFYKKTLPGLKKPNPYYTLNLATRLFADEFIQPEQRYAAILETSYDTGIQRLNFANAPAAAKVINDWCSNVTQNKLQQLVQEDNIQSNVLLMVNAIYFKGLWRTQFNESFPGVFFRTPAQQLRVNYMEQTDYFYYYNSQSLDARILRLPYKGKKFSMFILLPNSKGGVEQLTQDLENDQLKRMQWMMDETKVKLTMPKFKFDFDKNVKETLMQLGITEIFTNSASLPGLARGADVAGKLRVSNIFQKAGIEVNEQGTEAYAATVVEIENKFGGSSMVQEFNVNRPFIFFIEEEGTGNIIFAGKVHEPMA